MTLTFAGFFDPQDGYGHATVKIGQVLRELRPDIRLLDMRGAAADWASEETQWEIEGDVIALCTPDWLPAIKAQRVISHTMFETDTLPADWKRKINDRAVCVAVPCEWNKKVFEANGITRPVHVTPWGVSSDDYPYIDRDRAPDSPYTFLWSGTADRRKGWDVAYLAFDKTFSGVPDARLILHFRDPLPVPMRFSDRNVSCVVGRYDVAQQAHLLSVADCYLFPSRGEGWGLPPREAASTGLPVVVTRYGGLEVDVDRWALPVGISGRSKAEYGWWEEIGQWVDPDVDQVAAAMRWCFECRAESAEFGKLASLWLKRHATWTRTALALLRVYDTLEAL